MTLKEIEAIVRRMTRKLKTSTQPEPVKDKDADWWDREREQDAQYEHDRWLESERNGFR